jgi:hypothetical protein
MTYEEAAIQVLKREGARALTYGHFGLLDEIARLAGCKREHPMNRQKAVLDALERSPRFEKKYGRWGFTNRRSRGFWLKK